MAVTSEGRVLAWGYDSEKQCSNIPDLAEAIDNRVAIVYGGLEQILMCMMSEDDQVQEQGKQRYRQTS